MNWTRVRLLAAALVAGALTSTCVAPAAARDRIYWASNTGQIRYANLDGSNPTTIHFAHAGQPGGPAVSNVFGLTLDPATGTIYWMNGSGTDTTIWVANLDGSGGRQLEPADVASAPGGIALNRGQGRIYWSNDSYTDSVSFARLDGSGAGQLNTTGTTAHRTDGIAIDRAGGRLFLANFEGGPEPNNPGSLSYVLLDNSGGNDLDTYSAPVSEPDDVAYDRPTGLLYWVNFRPSSIGYANIATPALDSGALSTAGASSSTNYAGLAIDRDVGRVYFTGYGTPSSSRISYARLDGSGGHDLSIPQSHVGTPIGIAILEVPRPSGPASVEGGAVAGADLTCSRPSWLPDAAEAHLFRAPRLRGFEWLRDRKVVKRTPMTGRTARTAKLGATVAGNYRCRALAANAAGTGAAASAVHKVEATAMITSATIHAPAGAARFSFEGSKGTTGFACALVRTASGKKPPAPQFSPCASPKSYSGLAHGNYIFEVRARSTAGAGPAAKRSFSI